VVHLAPDRVHRKLDFYELLLFIDLTFILNNGLTGCGAPPEHNRYDPGVLRGARGHGHSTV